MDFWDVILRRRSVRKFEHEGIPENAIEEIIKAATVAPSGSNAKNWHFIVVKDASVRESLRSVVKKKIGDLVSRMKSQRARDEFLGYSKYFTFFADAPAVIAVVMKKYDSLSVRMIQKYGDSGTASSTAGVQNVAAAIENMLLAATAMGLGSCWMTGPLIAKKELERILGVAQPDNLLALVPVGVPKGEVPGPHVFPENLDEVMTVI